MASTYTPDYDADTVYITQKDAASANSANPGPDWTLYLMLAALGVGAFFLFTNTK